MERFKNRFEYLAHVKRVKEIARVKRAAEQAQLASDKAEYHGIRRDHDLALARLLVVEGRLRSIVGSDSSAFNNALDEDPEASRLMWALECLEWKLERLAYSPR